MSDIKSLQEIINERAEKRLDNDIATIWEFVRSNNLLQTNDDKMPKLFTQFDANGEKSYKGTAPKWAFEPAGAFMKELKKYYLPQYLEHESQNFVKKVDELMEFKDNTNYDY